LSSRGPTPTAVFVTNCSSCVRANCCSPPQPHCLSGLQRRHPPAPYSPLLCPAYLATAAPPGPKRHSTLGFSRTITPYLWSTTILACSRLKVLAWRASRLPQ